MYFYYILKNINYYSELVVNAEHLQIAKNLYIDNITRLEYFIEATPVKVGIDFTCLTIEI